MPTGSKIAWCRQKRTKARNIRGVTALQRESLHRLIVISLTVTSVHDSRSRSCNRRVNFFKDVAHSVAKFPVRIMRLELAHVADPPDVVADAIGFLVAPV